MNIDRLRAETEGCAHTTHLNNAGAALMPACVHKAIVDHLHEEVLHGSYEMANKAAPQLDELYGACARLVGAKNPSEIAILESATHAWTTAFYSIPFDDGDVVLTCSSEYAANYVAMLQLQQRKGIQVVEIKAAPTTGEVDLDDLRAKIKTFGKKIKCVAITHIPTNGGLVNPCEKIGELIKNKDFTVPFYLVDACQTVGQMPVNVDKLRCDFLSATSRKYLRGPRGIGFLYVRGSVMEDLDPITIDHFGAPWVATAEFKLRPDARRFEKWESNIANRLGLRAAVNYALGLGLDNIWSRIEELSTRLRHKLSSDPRLKGVVTLTDLGTTKCGIVTFLIRDVEAKVLQQELGSKYKINVSVSSRGATRLDMDRRNLDDLLRASVHYYNTEEELDALVDAVAAIRANTVMGNERLKKELQQQSTTTTSVSEGEGDGKASFEPSPEVQQQQQQQQQDIRAARFGAPPSVVSQQQEEDTAAMRETRVGGDDGGGGGGGLPLATYNVTLNQTTIAANNNKYYCLTIRESTTNSGNYEYERRWGRVGSEGQQNTMTCKTLEEAIPLFEKTFRDKTGRGFADRYDPAPYPPGKYTLLDLQVECGDGFATPPAEDEADALSMGA